MLEKEESWMEISAHGDFITGFLELSDVAGYNDNVGTFAGEEASHAFA